MSRVAHLSRRALILLVPVLLVITSGPTAQAAGHHSTAGATVTFAEEPSSPPNYIFPMFSGAYWTTANVAQFQPLFYRPLYWVGRGGSPVVNESLSLAEPPVFSDGNKVVTVTLKHYLWSDGTPVTSRDVEFWINLLRANKADYAPYVPGDFPDNMVAARYLSPRTFSFTFNRGYNPEWITMSALASIVPLPQQAWDRTAASGAVGNYDRTAGGARAVYRLLAGRAAQVSSYASDPLWKVVDGPWVLKRMTTFGYAVMLRNRRYSGPGLSSITEFIEEPFTSDTAEFDALRAGQVTYGYVPTQDLSELGYLRRSGFDFQPWTQWGVNYLPMNYTNPAIGPIIRQLYVRQTMQLLIDQPAYIGHIYSGYSYPTYGPVPVRPANPFLTSYEKRNPYPYDPSRARSLLRSHGWDVVPNGVTTCQVPARCGAGIHKGTALSFNLLYSSGIVAITETMEAIQSSFATAGIRVALSSAPVGTVLSEATPCSGKSSCRWEMIDDVVGWSYAPLAFPDGGPLFGTGAGGNIGGYNSPIMDRLILESHTSSTLAGLYAYENFAAAQVPDPWIPMLDFQYSEVSGRLHGALPQNPLGMITPESWRLSS